MKIAVISTQSPISRIWSHVARVSSHDVVLIPVSKFKTGVATPRMAGWHTLMDISPDCIWLDHHDLGLYGRLFQLYGHEDIPIIGYLRGDIWTEVNDLIEYLLGKREKRKKRTEKEKKSESEEGKKTKNDTLWSLIKDRKNRKPGLTYLYNASLPFILVYKLRSFFLMNLSMNYYDLLVCISEWLESRAHQEMPKMATSVWYRGMDPAPFLTVKEMMPLTHPCVGILQNHSIYRKASALLEFAPVVEQLPDVHFYISEGISRTSEFFSLVKETLGRYKNVHFLKITPADVPQFLSSIDCFALVSGLDAFPSTVREAQLARAPVVASNVGGIHEATAASSWNRIVENNDTEQWVETLNEFINGRGQNEEGRTYVISKFRWEVSIQEFERICSREISRKSTQ